MKIKISIVEKSTTTITCDDNNQILDVLKILLEKDVIGTFENSVISERMKRKFSVLKTFNECGIQTGDTLYVNTKNSEFKYR